MFTGRVRCRGMSPASAPAERPALDKPTLAILALTYAFCAANMLRVIVAPDTTVPPWDFSCFWYAGQAWLAGVSPYDAAAAASAGPAPEYFSDRPFFYPPASRPLFEAFALVPFEASRNAFAVLSVTLWAAICAVVTLRLPTAWPPLVRHAAMPVFISIVMIPARMSVEEGQTVVILVAAVAALVMLGHRRADRVHWLPMALILTALSLKPQLGLPIAAVAVLRWADWRGVAAASLLVGTLTLYGAAGRPDVFLAEFLHNLSLYGDYPENQPTTTSGSPTLIALAGLPKPPSLLLAGLATLAGLGAALSRLPREQALLLGLSVALLILPNHRHGYLLLVPLIPVVLAAPRPARVVMGGASLMMAYSMVVRYFSDPQHYFGTFAVDALTETAAIVLFAGAAAAWLLPSALPQRSELLVERPHGVVA